MAEFVTDQYCEVERGDDYVYCVCGDDIDLFALLYVLHGMHNTVCHVQHSPDSPDALLHNISDRAASEDKMKCTGLWGTMHDVGHRELKQ
ncbi:hypothetical protein BaRGS_00020766 [Batillaria attramentaria]|uniref:Uncharacterized protein n=1 Tax=Batillaria attramentaria TaxID=370345 RepID=A0ABD0KL85_9CAEN